MIPQAAATSVGPIQPNDDMEVVTVEHNGEQFDVQVPKGTSDADVQAYVQQQAQPADVAAPTETQGQYGDDTSQPLTHLSPDDEAAYGQLLHTASPDELQAFLEKRGFSSDRAKLEAFVAGRDHAKAAGTPVGYDVNYAYAPKASDGVQAFGDGVAQGGSLGTADEIHGFLNGVGSLLHGGSYSDAYNRTVDDDRAQLGADRQQHGVLSTVGELAGGAALPFGLEKAGLTASMEAVALKAGREAIEAGATPEAARIIGARAVAKRLATDGGAYGAAYGVGSGNTTGERLTGGATGGVLGTAGGALFGKLGIRAAGKAVDAAWAVPTEAQLVGQAADRQGLDLLPADVSGPGIRGLTAATAQTPLGVVPIAKAAKHLDTQAETRLSQIGTDLGEAATDREGVGQAAIEGAQKYVGAAKRAGGRLYDIAADKAANAKIDLTNTRDLVDQQIARLQQVPGGGQGLSDLQALRSSLNQPATVQGVRDMRTEMFVSPEFRNTPVEGRMKAIVNSASRDVEQGLRSQGLGDAADAYRAADDNWRSMLVNIQRNIEPIIGKMSNLKSPEGVATALNSAVKNNGGRVAQFTNSLPAEQQGIVRASLLNPLGRDNSGNFSISRFASDWAKVSPAAKRLAFGPESAAALNDLATVGSGAKTATSYANHSNTGRVASVLATASLGLAGVKTLGAAVALPYVTGKLLASPRFARWLARAPRTNLSDISYIERLGRIAQAEPAIAGDISNLQQHLLDSIKSSPMNAAAQQGGDNGRPVDGNQGQQQSPNYGAQP